MGFYKDLAQIFYYIIRSFKMIFKKKNLFFIGIIVFVVLVFGFYNSVFADSISTVYSNLGLNNAGVIVNANGYSLISFQTDNNFIYTVTNNYVYGRSLRLLVSDSVAVGSSTEYVTFIEPGQTYDFVGSGRTYVIEIGTSNVDFVDISYRSINGFDDTTNKLTDEISVNNLWSVFPPLLVAVGVLFALGYVVVKKVLKRDNRIY